MNKLSLSLVLIALASIGCRTPRAVTSQSSEPLPPAATHTVVNESTTTDSAVRPAAHALLLLQPDNNQPPLSLPMASDSAPTNAAAPAELSLHSLEQIALSNNPAIARAEARVRALRGKWVQAGLPPNPTAGYLATEMGNEGKAGQQGGYVGQDFITGGKLRLNRAVIAQEILRAEQVQAAMQLRVQTDVRKA
jgi:cobalt-zinc-cadmium efflux system outer membrane protein